MPQLVWTVVLEKTLESPLDCKEIQPVYSEGDEPWDFFGRNNAKAETPVLWPPHAKSWLIGKDSDAGRDWGQEEKGTTEDEMAGWHHWLDGREFERTPGVGDGQGVLACWDSRGLKESDTTERLNWTELKALSSLPPLFGRACYVTWLILPLKNGTARIWPLSLWKVGLRMCAHHLVMLTLCDPTDCSLQGSSVHGILQARILEWVAIPFSRGSCQPRIEPGSLALKAKGLWIQNSNFSISPSELIATLINISNNQKDTLWTQSPRGCKQGTEASMAISRTSLCCWPQETNFILENKGQK